MAMEITEGYFDETRLDGLRVAGVYNWPGPVHEGHGTWFSIIDKNASEAQAEALFTILGGQEQEPNTGFAIYGSTIEHEPEPVFAAIEFEFDIEARKGRFVVENILEADVEPIKNPVTGKPHFISIRPHQGFEFREAEMASANYWSKGEIDQQHTDRFAAISYVSYGPKGIIPEESYPHRNA